MFRKEHKYSLKFKEIELRKKFPFLPDNLIKARARKWYKSTKTLTPLNSSKRLHTKYEYRLGKWNSSSSSVNNSSSSNSSNLRKLSAIENLRPSSLAAATKRQKFRLVKPLPMSLVKHQGAVIDLCSDDENDDDKISSNLDRIVSMNRVQPLNLFNVQSPNRYSIQRTLWSYVDKRLLQLVDFSMETDYVKNSFEENVDTREKSVAKIENEIELIDIIDDSENRTSTSIESVTKRPDKLQLLMNWSCDTNKWNIEGDKHCQRSVIDSIFNDDSDDSHSDVDHVGSVDSSDEKNNPNINRLLNLFDPL